MDVRGRKEPSTKLERIFWQEFPNLLIDDPDERLNGIIGTLRNAAVKYFEDKNSRQLDALVIQKPAEERDMITLKWGTLKAWKIKTEKAKELLKKYVELGVSFSAMQQHDTPEQKQIICELIDASNVETVYFDWDGKYVTKEEAKKYVMEYGKK